MRYSWAKRIVVLAVIVMGCGLAITAGPLFGQVSGPQSGPGAGAEGAYQAAERLLAERSYQLALGKYREFAAQGGLTAEQKREAAFRIADCSWRSGDASLYEEAAQSLKEQIISAEQDRWWAEANFSLAEYLLKTNQWGNQEEIKALLIKAREFWAGYADSDAARPRFIEATFVLADHVTRNWGWYFETPAWGNAPHMSDKGIPPPSFAGPVGIKQLMEEVLKVADRAEDKAKATYYLAMAHMNAGGEEQLKSAEGYFRAIIKDYGTSEWLDDAYYNLGQLFERQPDFVKALQVYSEFSDRFRAGQSQFVDDVARRVKEITEPVIRPNVGFTFLPGSEIRFGLQWRNVKEAEFRFYKLDLPEALRFDPSRTATDYNRGVGQYQDLLRILVETGSYQGLPVALSFRRALKEEGKHLWYGEDKGLAEWRLADDKEKPEPQAGILPPGAYLLMVRGGQAVGYELVVVSDMGLSVRTAGRRALFFAFDTRSGEPRTDVQVKFHYRYYNDSGNWVWDEGGGVTDKDGLLTVNLNTSANRHYYNQHQLFGVAAGETGQAFLQSSYYSNSQGKGESWLYAFADRPAYRPNEEISFKGILRKYDGASFLTPSGIPVKAYLYDARGNKVLEKDYVLNEFGSFSDSLKLDDKAALGEYRLELYSGDGSQHLASASLFRLEEYKLPEFLVNIKPRPKEDGQFANVYRLGEKVAVELDAQYYFGGPVANAKVEYLVYERPFYWRYIPSHPYQWYYSTENYNYYYGPGILVKKDETVTDAEGKAVIEIATDKTKGADLTYRIEARVVDQSRREITSSAEVRATARPFFIALTPKSNLYRPGDRAEVAIRTVTANDEPVSVEGKVSVSRNWWREPVLEDMKFRADKAPAMEYIGRRPKGGVFIPDPHYEEQPLFTRFVKTDAKGQAVFEFQPQDNGFYVLTFTGFDSDGSPVESSAHVYVCDKDAKDIGLRYGGLQIIAEKDTYSPGETMRMMLVADKPGARVLLTAEAEEIEDARLVRLEGPVKLVELRAEDSFVPNIFVTAVSAADHQVRVADLEIVVPPDSHFLNVRLSSDKETYQPGEEGRFEIAVADKDGRPVAAELGVSLVDASVFYIQSDLAQDIRQFFYGAKRSHSVQLQTSLYQRPYLKFVRNEQSALVQDERLWGADQDKGAVHRRKLAAQGAAQDLKEEESLDRLSNGLALPTQVGGMSGKKDAYRGSRELKSKMVEGREDASSIMPALEKAPAAPGEAGVPLAEPQVRQDFRSTVFWGPLVTTDAEGRAAFTAKFPDSLTAWRATARGISAETDVGSAAYDVRTKKEIIVRLQAPRFFTERDRATVSANVHNFTDVRQKIKVSLKAEGVKLEGEPETWVDVDPEGEKRVDWTVVAEKSGTATFVAAAQTAKAADAMQKQYPVVPHGIEKFIARALALKLPPGQAGAGPGAASGEIEFEVPRERIAASTSLRLTLSPSMAAAMLDALPYLADYPYGCVEQTMSRFLPAVVVAKTMRELGFDARDVEDYIENVLAPRGDPQGHPKRRQDTTYSRLREMTRAGLERLYDFQHTDGGWGWWKEGDSDRFMTAYVVWGLALAREADMDIRSDALARGVAYLDKNLVEEEDEPDMLAWMLYALASARHQSPFQAKQTARLWEMRDKLNPYTRALFALAMRMQGRNDEALVLARNVLNGLQQDAGNQTAHWGESGMNYRWSEGGVEATAFSLKALLNITPDSEFVAPAVRWLALNRRGASWKNTRDTAIAILALADYLKASGELRPDYDYEVLLNGRPVAQGHVDPGNMFTFDRYIDLPPEAITDGMNKVQVRLSGVGTMYLAAHLKYFTLEEGITAEGNEIFVERKYYRQSQKETLLKGYVDDWKPLKDGDVLKSGDRVKVELEVEAKNNYEYLVFEDPKPAGLEAVELKSGSGDYEKLTKQGKATGEKGWLYREFRDRKAVFFVDKLKQGRYRISYELRAEVPGDFHAMPDQAQAMYVPEIRANSAENRIKVED